jgi:hypothetical protein
MENNEVRFHHGRLAKERAAIVVGRAPKRLASLVDEMYQEAMK